MAPKVFVSHASEDKERFVINFATKLREKGIEAWFDKWEIYPGDSLVDKIFEEGIKEAQAVVVIISKNSVNKPWVREELNTSVIRRINGVSKLIPVIIDDCVVPEALHTIVWERVKNLDDYELELERIVATIFGFRDKPPLGSAPFYARSPISVISSLTMVDSMVLKLACEIAIEATNPWVDPYSLTSRAQSLSCSEGELSESVEVLNRRGYIETLREQGVIRIPMFKITLFGFEEYAKSCIQNYDGLVKEVVSQVVNFEQKNNKFNFISNRSAYNDCRPYTGCAR